LRTRLIGNGKSLNICLGVKRVNHSGRYGERLFLRINLYPFNYFAQSKKKSLNYFRKKNG